MLPEEAEYHKSFHAAEKHIKQAENLLGRLNVGKDLSFLRGLLFPAINELRYSAYHAIEAHSTDDPVAKAGSFVSARKHCFRASFDALEAQVQYLIGVCAVFQNDYRLVSIGEVIPNYQADCLVLDEINQNALARADYEHREDYWKEAAVHLSRLEPICKRWEIGREELNKKLKREIRNRRLQTLTAIGVIIAIVTFILKLF